MGDQVPALPEFTALADPEAARAPVALLAISKYSVPVPPSGSEKVAVRAGVRSVV